MFARSVLLLFLVTALLFPRFTQAQDPAEAYAQVNTQWKEINEKIRAIITEARSIDRSNTEAINEIQARFEALRTEATALAPQLRATALEAYRAKPNEDEELAQTLFQIAASELSNDQYGAAAEITGLLLENKSDVQFLHDVAGMVAFGMDQFEQAEQLFAVASENGQLRSGQRYMEGIAGIQENWKKELEIRKAEAEADDLPRVKLETSEGDILIELFENQAPNSVANFVSLVESGYYDGLTFHRVLPNFMAQGGCPDGTGGGGPGYKIPCECEREDYRHHFSGTLSMAHAGKDTGGSQFFLTFLATPHLDNRHTAFGRVIEGMDVLGKLVKINPQRPSGATPSTINKATVVRKRDHAYVPKKVGE